MATNEPPIDFTMTYPCFVPLRSNGIPYTFNAEGDNAVGIFTDDDLLSRFIASLKPKPSRIGRIKVDNAEALRQLLLRCDETETPEGRVVSHVIIDPVGGPKARTHSIRAFVQHLQQPEKTPQPYSFDLPVFTYLIEPGSRPGFLQDPKSGSAFVPLWTDSDAFEIYLQKSGLAEKGATKLRMDSREELVGFLRSVPTPIQLVMFDPSPTVPSTMVVWEIAKLILALSGPKW